MKKWKMWTLAAMVFGFAACKEEGLDAVTTVDSSFETDANGWIAEFAEYSTKTDTASLSLRAGRTALPFGLDTTRFGYRLAGANRSDDMFMYIKKKVTGFVPNMNYEVIFNIDVATKYPEGTVGIGGPPSSSVYMKVGATTVEPKTTLTKGEYVFNLDKGNQSQGGKDAIVIGDVASSRQDTTYSLVQRSNASQPIMIRPDATGTIWLLVGTDSGFEGFTSLYYDRITVTISERP